MGLLHAAKLIANRFLESINVRVDSLTAERAEKNRLIQLKGKGQFDEAIFPVLPQFETCDPSQVIQEIKQGESRITDLANRGKQGSYLLNNDYYTTPDAEVLYAIVQLHRPSRIVEIGSGYSTQLFRLAIQDAGLATQLTSIDPDPRQNVATYADTIVRARVETLEELDVFAELGSNDIIFVDSSHEIRPGNDVLHIVFNILPVLAPGVLIHFHDIFLPYEYPKDWIITNGWTWTEQYLIQALLTANHSYEVIWPAHYLQRTRPSFPKYFKRWNNSTARSLWIRKR
jgi:predicted O-methyltransferase YrrM